MGCPTGETINGPHSGAMAGEVIGGDMPCLPSSNDNILTKVWGTAR